MIETPERVIQRQILNWLAVHHFTHWRVPLAGMFLRGPTGGKRMVKNPMTGHPDIAGILRPSGRYFAIEVKRPKLGRMSEVQHLWRAKIEGAGGLYVVATCVEDVMRQLIPGLEEAV